MEVRLQSACKVNLLLNILGKRPDGFHELETLMQPVGIYDFLTLKTGGAGIELSCNHPELPTGRDNLVYRAAEKFVETAGIAGGVTIHLEKNLPLAAGLGGGSANAAVTLLGMNQLHGTPLSETDLHRLAAELGSDVPFFLQDQPALARGRGEQIVPLDRFAALRGKEILLIHPGFGVSTAWAYKNLARFPDALQGRPGRAESLATSLALGNLNPAEFYNSLECPVLEKFPLLAMFIEFLRGQGALAAMMSGSGSTTFGIFSDAAACDRAKESFIEKFGSFCWMRSVPL